MMVVIATADPDLARRMGEVIESRKTYLVKIEDATEFRHKIHSNQPEVVILDVRLGGSRFEALQELPAIVTEVRSRPAVIVLLPWTSEIAKSAAAELGAFEVLSLDRRSWIRELPRVVLDAQAARLAGALELPKKREPGVLH